MRKSQFFGLANLLPRSTRSSFTRKFVLITCWGVYGKTRGNKAKVKRTQLFPGAIFHSSSRLQITIVLHVFYKDGSLIFHPASSWFLLRIEKQLNCWGEARVISWRRDTVFFCALWIVIWQKNCSVNRSWLKCIPWRVKCTSPWLWIVNR